MVASVYVLLCYERFLDDIDNLDHRIAPIVLLMLPALALASLFAGLRNSEINYAGLVCSFTVGYC